MRVVLDSNVLLAAFATHGLCEGVLLACLDRHELILSDAIAEEVERHLAGKFKVPSDRVRKNLGFLRENATLVVPQDVPASACRDSTDRVILGTAAAGRADCIVTGDEDLLVLGEYEGVPILSPRAFHEKLRSRGR